MNNLDYSLRQDSEEAFVLNAKYLCGMSREDAVIKWRNFHNNGKYVVCESRKGFEGGRMFLRIVTSTMSDAMRKSGWWDTFTIATFPVPCGIWLCKIKTHRIDRNGFLNMIVEPVAEFPKMKFHFVFEDTNGTWNSPAIHLMFGGKNFLSDYKFPQFRDSNFAEFRKRFPQYAELMGDALREAVLRDWLRGDVELKEIEDALNEKTEWEKLVRKVQVAVAYGVTKTEFPSHPNFAEKIVMPENSASWFNSQKVGYGEVEDYIRRNMESYEGLVRDGKIEPVTSDYPLDQVEAVLAYRKSRNGWKNWQRRKPERRRLLKKKGKADICI